MKKLFLAFIISVIALVGCDLNPQNTYYFYSMFELPDGEINNTDPIDFEVSRVWWKPTDFTIIISKGKDGTGYSYDDASGQINLTTFTLTIDGENCVTDGVKTVRQLDEYWHVVQSFTTGQLSKGDYILTGRTDDTGGLHRSNVVRLKVR